MKQSLLMAIFLASISSYANESIVSAQGSFVKPTSSEEQRAWAFRIHNPELITQIEIVGNVLTFEYRHYTSEHDQEFNKRFYPALDDLGLTIGAKINEAEKQHRSLPHYTYSYNHDHYIIHRTLLPLNFCVYVDCSVFWKRWVANRFHDFSDQMGKAADTVIPPFHFKPKMVSYLLRKIEPTLCEAMLNEAEITYSNWLLEQGVLPRVFVGDHTAGEFGLQLLFQGALFGLVYDPLYLPGVVGGSAIAFSYLASYLIAKWEDDILRKRRKEQEEADRRAAERSSQLQACLASDESEMGCFKKLEDLF